MTITFKALDLDQSFRRFVDGASFFDGCLGYGGHADFRFGGMRVE